MQNLQRSSVTRDHLKQLVDLQRAEFHALVRAETEPLHNAVTQIHSSICGLARENNQMAERMRKMESRVEQFPGFQEPIRDAADPAYNQIAFVNFPQQSTVQQRLDAMTSFMKTHFPKITPVHTNLFSDKKGEPSIHGFVQLADAKYVKRVVDECKSSQHSVSGFPEVKVKRAKSAVDRNRDWALYRAEEMLKEDLRCIGKNIEKKRGKDRGIIVDGTPAFVQSERYAKGGNFVGIFADLHLS